MSIEDRINSELTRFNLPPLVAEQIECLHDPARLEEAAGMLSDLRDRCGVRLPLPAGVSIGGPYLQEEEAVAAARRVRADFPVVTVDRMATDESRSTGVRDEYYVSGYSGPGAAVALAQQSQWVTCWLRGQKCSSDA